MSRYSQQSILPEIGEAGQRAIENASVLCVGAGGLASPVLQYLVAAGVGHIGIIDGDVVSESNLQRQVLFHENQIGQSKALSAKANLEKLNSKVKIEAMAEMLVPGNAEAVFSRFEVIVDCTDRFSAKYLINDTAVKLGKPVIYGSVTGMEGQLAVFDSRNGPCFRCIYPEVESAIPNCAESGVLGPVVGMIASLQAAEVLKYLVSRNAPQKGWDYLLSIDARDLSFFKTKIRKNLNCPVCVDPSAVKLHDRVEMGENRVSPEKVLRNPKDYVLIDVREMEERTQGAISGSVHLPISLLRKDATILKELDLGRTWVPYCVSGARAREALRIFADHGFQGALLDHENGVAQFFDL